MEKEMFEQAMDKYENKLFFMKKNTITSKDQISAAKWCWSSKADRPPLDQKAVGLRQRVKELPRVPAAEW